MYSKKISKTLTIFLICFNIIQIAAFFTLLLYSLNYWGNNYPYNLGIEDKMFYVALGVTIITVISQWIEGRGKSILRSVKLLKGGSL